MSADTAAAHPTSRLEHTDISARLDATPPGCEARPHVVPRSIADGCPQQVDVFLAKLEQDMCKSSIVSAAIMIGCLMIGCNGMDTRRRTSGGPSDIGRTSFDAGVPDPNPTTSGPQDPPSECLDVNCEEDWDCPGGYQCNDAMNPPVCTRLYCGRDHSYCSSDELCSTGYKCIDNQCLWCDQCGGNDTCSADLMSDEANCGACGHRCVDRNGEFDSINTCEDGRCVRFDVSITSQTCDDFCATDLGRDCVDEPDPSTAIYECGDSGIAIVDISCSTTPTPTVHDDEHDCEATFSGIGCHCAER